MKKVLLLATVVLFGGASQAQITLDSSSVGPIGSVFINGVDTDLPVGYDLGMPGTNVTWDFSQLNQDEYDTLNFVDPNGTPNGADFPTATIAVQQASQGADAYAYFRKTDLVFELLGFSADPLQLGSAIVVYQTPPSKSGIFPWTYQSTLMDTSTFAARIDGTFLGFPGVDSVELVSTTNRSLTCDSWGSLILWGGTYSALRNKEIRETRDITSIRFFGSWTTFQDTSYTDSSFIWMNDTKGYTLATAEYIGGVLDQISYQDANPVSVINHIDANTLVFPNPAHDFVIVQNEMGSIATVQILGLNGQLLKSVQMDGSRAELSVQGLTPALYLVQGLDENGMKVMQRKLIVR